MKTRLSIFIVGLITLFSCGNNSQKNQENEPISTSKTGKELYKMYCVACHGNDGKMAFSGAKDLSESTMDLDTRIKQITHGKGVMNAFKNIMSEEEIESVAVYIEELRVPKE